ncbi:MAG TPA: thiolase [Streptosporangiaceae bacterium]|jgi:acetyl-CoA C-acetyltransferase|nr:thiolase [Streptosporangiaceae bacterium]
MTAPAAAIAGIYEFPKRVAGGLSALQIKAECAARALEDAGLNWSDVDAVYDASEAGRMQGLTIAEYFGITPRVVDTTAVGGSSYEYHAAHAARDIAAGQANVALLTYGSTARSDSRAIGTGARAAESQPQPPANMERPYGLTLIGNYAMVARRHMAQYGTTPEQLAQIAVTTRRHATRNPQAVAGLAGIGIRDTGEITVGDVLGSRLIADPLHLLECCIVSDGGGAVVIVSRDVASGIRSQPAWILGTGEAVGYPAFGADLTTTAAARSGPEAFGRAGVRPDEIDIAMIYDSFTITVLAILEDLGFAKKGEGGPLAAGGHLAFDQPGGPALNTDGGGLSSNHPGMRGIFLLIEAARQLRGESTSQVPGARLAVAHGNGGQLGTRHAAATIVLGTE